MKVCGRQLCLSKGRLASEESENFKLLRAVGPHKSEAISLL